MPVRRRRTSPRARLVGGGGVSHHGDGAGTDRSIVDLEGRAVGDGSGRSVEATISSNSAKAAGN
jgi:hypothetical protein